MNIEVPLAQYEVFEVSLQMISSLSERQLLNVLNLPMDCLVTLYMNFGTTTLFSFFLIKKRLFHTTNLFTGLWNDE